MPPGLALVLLIVTPLVWSVPLALVAAELGAMLPVEGGYYRWAPWHWVGSGAFSDGLVELVLFVPRHGHDRAFPYG